MFVGKLVIAMLNSEVFLVADIHEAVIASPAIRVNDTSKLCLATDYALESGFWTIRNYLLFSSKPGHFV